MLTVETEVDLGLEFIGVEPQVALFPAHQVEERVGDLLSDELLEHVGLDVSLVHQDLTELAIGLVLLLDLHQALGLAQLLLRDDSRANKPLARGLDRPA